jgi:hypothetical protein
VCENSSWFDSSWMELDYGMEILIRWRSKRQHQRIKVRAFCNFVRFLAILTRMSYTMLRIGT